MDKLGEIKESEVEIDSSLLGSSQDNNSKKISHKSRSFNNKSQNKLEIVEEVKESQPVQLDEEIKYIYYNSKHDSK